MMNWKGLEESGSSIICCTIRYLPGRTETTKKKTSVNAADIKVSMPTP
jgi:hypothetical protein